MDLDFELNDDEFTVRKHALIQAVNYEKDKGLVPSEVVKVAEIFETYLKEGKKQ